MIFVHIGDLHLTDAKQRNFADFLAILAQIETETADLIDFVVLPGDNADNGTRSQYRLAATGLRMLSVPVHVLPGDHDMEPGNLSAFYDTLCADPLPKMAMVQGTRCLFLDISGSGSGGPDFRLGPEQARWIEQQLQAAREAGQTSVLFMHTYPDDLRGRGETQQLNQLLTDHDVALVDIGHTHYNELANDGRTIFAATRSTGQIEEGPVGYSIASLDGGVVSWRFKVLDDAFPFVVITSPADHRLLRQPSQAVSNECEVRAVVLGRNKVQGVVCQAEGGPWIAMTRRAGARAWSARLPLPPDRLVTITVRAVDDTNRPGFHTIRAATPSYEVPNRPRNGSDAASIGAWPENGIFGTQLGPNRNGQPSS